MGPCIAVRPLGGRGRKTVTPAMDIPPGSHTRFPISDTSITSVGTPHCFVQLGLQKRQSRGLEKKRSFVYLGLMVNRQPTHLKQRFFVLSAPKQTQDHTDFRHDIPPGFICYRPSLNLAFKPTQYSHLLSHISPTFLAVHRSFV